MLVISFRLSRLWKELRGPELDGTCPSESRANAARSVQAHLSLAIACAAFSIPSVELRHGTRLLQRRGIDVPFIIVSSAVAEECLHQGCD